MINARRIIDSLDAKNLQNRDFLLEVPFTTDEVRVATNRLKRRKAPEPDHLLAEYIVEGGDSLIEWLTSLFNAIIEFESVPNSLKHGIVVPVYKGHGKYPLRVDNYRGVTLSSVIAKVLEFLILERLEIVSGGWHSSPKSVSLQKVSCADSILQLKK